MRKITKWGGTELEDLAKVYWAAIQNDVENKLKQLEEKIVNEPFFELWQNNIATNNLRNIILATPNE